MDILQVSGTMDGNWLCCLVEVDIYAIADYSGEMKIVDYMARGYNEVEVQKRALDELKKQFDISFREVCLYDNGR